jgi:chromosome segregation ATPase
LRLDGASHKHLAKQERPVAGVVDDMPMRKKRRAAAWDDADPADLRARLDQATTRAKEAEEAARSLAASLQQATDRLEAVERQSPDERVAGLKEALRRSEAERALLRAGRPETQLEAEVRELRVRVRESQALAKAAEALTAGRGDLSAVQEQLSAAARRVDEAVERAKIAEGRADAVEDRARAADDMVLAAEQRIDLLEVKIQEIAAPGLEVPEDPEIGELRRQLAEGRTHAAELQERAARAEERLATAGSFGGPEEELLRTLEERVIAAEARASEAEERLRAFEDEVAEGGSRFRQQLGLSAAGRKLAPPPPPPQEPEMEMDLRAAIARGLRAPLTRASGLTLSLQGMTESNAGKNALRQLSSALRRLDQLAADLHDAHRMIDGTLPITRRRTDLAALLSSTLDDATHLEDRLVRLDADTVSARVDPVRVRQIVEGMLDAARDRTRSGAAIVVRLRETQSGARITVEDDNRMPARIGPDMSLAVRLAELHGTEITVDGSTFRVVFSEDER